MTTRTSAAQVEASGYSLKEIVTIASLIEKETDGTDQAHDRLRHLQPSGRHREKRHYGLLQIDASLLYALPDHEGAITNEDKAVDSPYNLYKYAGLPPTPIANPGSRRIDGGAEPRRHGLLLLRAGQGRQAPLLHHAGGAQRLCEQ